MATLKTIFEKQNTIKTIVIVDDDDMQRRLMRRLLQKEFGVDFEVVEAANLVAALDILTSQNREICGVITDNGFPLVEKGGRKGADYSVVGSAGTMLTRFMQSGTTGAAAEIELEHAPTSTNERAERLKELLGMEKYRAFINDLNDDKDLQDKIIDHAVRRYEQYISELNAVHNFETNIKTIDPELNQERKKKLKDVPVIWASGAVEREKILRLVCAAQGALIPNTQEFRDKTEMSGANQINLITGTPIAWTGKPVNFPDLIVFLRKHIVEAREINRHLPLDKRLIEAIRQSDVEVLQSLFEHYDDKIDATMISAGLAEAATVLDSTNAEKFVRFLLDFTHADPNCTYKVSDIHPVQFSTPLWAAINANALSVIDCLLMQDKRPINVTAELIAFAETKGSLSVVQLLKRFQRETVESTMLKSPTPRPG